MAETPFAYSEFLWYPEPLAAASQCKILSISGLLVNQTFFVACNHDVTLVNPAQKKLTNNRRRKLDLCIEW